jgi:hypothetical protein
MDSSKPQSLTAGMWNMIEASFGNVNYQDFFDAENSDSAFRDLLDSLQISDTDRASILKLLDPVDRIAKLWSRKSMEDLREGIQELMGAENRVFIPETKGMPERIEFAEHTILGTYQQLYYTGTLDGKEIQWIIGYQPSYTGSKMRAAPSAWVQKAFFKEESRKTNSYGLYPTNIGTSQIFNKPVEYLNQISEKTHVSEGTPGFKFASESKFPTVKDGRKQLAYTTANGPLQLAIPFLKEVIDVMRASGIAIIRRAEEALVEAQDSSRKAFKSKFSVFGPVYGWRKNLQEEVFNRKGDKQFKAMFKYEMRCALKLYIAAHGPIADTDPIDKATMLKIFRTYLASVDH